MKKRFLKLRQLEKFIDEQSKEVKAEYYLIVDKLERQGRLEMPFGEKIVGTNLFAIRVINAGNVRIFYVYGYDNKVYGLHGYVKKTRKIPQREMDKAIKTAKIMKMEGLIP